ncbi:hypothetical protein COMA2_100120 [Candidatus Nitrospira nitrificans]|uniref:Uncharacterized protein n=1 Tax=Candidatus Nitrospira nitrificans TaxID=1742973 RepID=A0A0S4L6S8_9BACT|nr:hypothetical protein COMA2_100120 [Candidatus Nitrospira nitrificans]
MNLVVWGLHPLWGSGAGILQPLISMLLRGTLGGILNRDLHQWIFKVFLDGTILCRRGMENRRVDPHSSNVSSTLIGQRPASGISIPSPIVSS